MATPWCQHCHDCPDSDASQQQQGRTRPPTPLSQLVILDSQPDVDVGMPNNAALINKQEPARSCLVVGKGLPVAETLDGLVRKARAKRQAMRAEAEAAKRQLRQAS